MCYEFKFSLWKIIIIFQRENLNYLIVCITQCTSFFQHVCSIVNMFAVRYLWKTTVTKHSDK